MTVQIESGRKPYLDGVRGVAACVVFFNHLLLALTGGSWIFNGSAAVCIFFVLSGFVLSELGQHSGLSFPAQVIRRYLRLIGPMLMTSLLAWALLALGAYRNQEAATLVDSWWLGNWYKFAPSFPGMIEETLYGVFVSGRSDYNCNLWTMRPELIGSVLVFLVSAVASTRRLRLLGHLAIGLYFWSDYVALFPVGALLHDFHPELERWVGRLWAKAPIFLFGLFLCAAPQKYLHLLHFPAVDGVFWHKLAATLVVGAVLHWSLLQGLLGSAPGRLLGRISFVLYLIHVPNICSLTSWMVLTLPVGIARVGAGATTAVVVFAVSIATYRYMDQMPTRWSRAAGYWFDSLLARRPAQEATQL